MVGVGFNFLSKSDFCSWIMLRESFRLAVTVCVCFCQLGSPIADKRTFI